MQNASNKPKSTEGEGFDTIIIGASQKVAFTGTNAKSTVLNKRTSIVRLLATNDCWVKVGIDANAVALADGTCHFVAKGVVQDVGIVQAWANGVQTDVKIGVIQDSAGGNLYITEGA